MFADGSGLTPADNNAILMPLEYSPGAIRAAIFIQKAVREVIDARFAAAGIRPSTWPDAEQKAWANTFANDLAGLIDSETQAPEALRLLEANVLTFRFLLEFAPQVSAEILNKKSELYVGIGHAAAAHEEIVAKIKTGK